MEQQTDETLGGTLSGILKRAVDDRTTHPWRYYRLDHDTMKRLLNEQAEQLDAAKAQLETLSAEVQSLRAERDSLAQQVAEMVAPEELRQWKEAAERAQAGWLDAGRRLDAAKAESGQLQKRVDHWRGWALFTYLKGGPDDPARSDADLQMAVAETNDADVSRAEAERDTLREAATKQLWALRELFHTQVQAFRDVAAEQTGPTRWCARRRADDWQKAADMLGQRLLALGLFAPVPPQTAEETQGK